MTEPTPSSSSAPPSAARWAGNWVLQIIIFAALSQVAVQVARYSGRALRYLGAPPTLAATVGFLVAMVVFFTFVKYFVAWRMPRQVPTEYIDLAPALQGSSESPLSPSEAPPLPSPHGESPIFPVPLDGAGFRRYSDQLERLGLVHLFDWRRVDPHAVIDTTYARIYVHPQQHCFARINQVFPLGAPHTAAHCWIESFYTQGYVLQTSNRAPDVMSYMLRLPRTFWERLAGADASTLWQRHGEQRELLLQTLDVALRQDISSQQFMQIVAEGHDSFRSAVRRKNVVVGLAEALWGRIHCPTAWMGSVALPPSHPN